MLCVIPFHRGDKPQTIKLANWINELGSVSDHECLLVFDESTTSEGVLTPLQSAFKSVSIFVVPNVPDADWASGNGDASACNEMWISTAWHIYYNKKCPWLWCEPDCCPMYPAWLDDIEAAYVAAGKKCLGAQVNASGGERMSGIAVYPDRVCDVSFKAMQATIVPWDIVGAPDFIKHGAFTRLIHHVLRAPNDKPTFPDSGSLESIPAGTALFHPCKDGALFDRIRELEKHIRRYDYPTVTKVGEVETPGAHNAASIPPPAISSATTWIGEVRERVKELAKLADTQARKHTLHIELREARLIGGARKRKKK